MAVSPTRVTMNALRAATPIGRVAIPEADQQITAQPHTFPTEKKQQKIVRQQQHDHRGDEQIHISEEATVAVVVRMNSAE